VVDVLAPPLDSNGDPQGFSRGTEGLEARVAAVETRTLGNVGYLGEWHSHPPFVPPDRSPEDERLLQYLQTRLEEDGVPALMVIVGAAGELSVHVGASVSGLVTTPSSGTVMPRR